MGKYNFIVILLWGSLLLGCEDITTSSTMSDGATNSTHVTVEQSAGNGISKELMDDLSTAIIQGNTKYIDTFLKLNSNLNHLNSLGETPLTLAATLGELEMVKQFINSGAKVNFPNQFGRTPLHKSIIHFQNDESTEIVSFLLKNGADTEILDQNSAPPVYYCLFNLSKPYFDSDVAMKSMKMLSELEVHGAKRSIGFKVPGLDKNRLINQIKEMLKGDIRSLSSNKVELIERIVDEAAEA